MAVLHFSSEPIEFTLLELSKTQTSHIQTLVLDCDLKVSLLKDICWGSVYGLCIADSTAIKMDLPEDS